jgi:hypothetical protein
MDNPYDMFAAQVYFVGVFSLSHPLFDCDFEVSEALYQQKWWIYSLEKLSY